MARKLPVSIHRVKYPPLWRYSHRFIAKGLRVTKCDGFSRHARGGHASYRGRKCLECKNPLTFLWDLDLGEPLIADYVRDSFRPATRLPFFICWQCMAASYSLISDSAIKCYPLDIQSQELEEGESPFLDNPQEIEPSPIQLLPIGSILDALLGLADVIGYKNLDQSAQETLARCIGRDVSSDFPDSNELQVRLVKRRPSKFHPPRCQARDLEAKSAELMSETNIFAGKPSFFTPAIR